MEYYIRKIDGISWMIKSDAPEAVTDHIIPSIPEIFHSDSFHTVRKYPPRTTGWVAYQHNGKDERLFIKDFGKFQGFKRFFFLWKISPAEKEGRVANFLTLRGINVVSPLAWGEKRSGRMLKACYLITKEIKDSMVLSNYLDNEWQKKDIETKSKEIKSLAYFMWRLHQNGVIQRDLHMDNLLIKVYKNNRVQPILFDLHKVKIKNKINSGEIIDNLTLLNFSSLHKLGRNIRYRFLHEYIKVSQTRLPEIKTIIKGINKKTGRRLFSFFKKRQKRCIKENKYFARYHKGHLKGFYLRSGSLDLIEILDQIEKVPGKDYIEFIKKSKKHTVIKDPSFKEEIIAKIDSPTGIMAGVKYLFYPSKAKRNWKKANSFRIRGIPTPTPLAFIERRRFGFLKSGYFITKVLCRAKNLDKYIEEEINTQKDKDCLILKRKLITRLFIFIRAMHDKGIYHGDLKASNIMVKKEGMELHLLDFDGVKIGNKVSIKKRLKDLNRIYIAIFSYFTKEDMTFAQKEYWKNTLNYDKDIL